MREFVAICPVVEDCPWEYPDKDDSGLQVDLHISVAHPELINTPGEMKATGQRYRTTLWAKYRRVDVVTA